MHYTFLPWWINMLNRKNIFLDHFSFYSSAWIVKIMLLTLIKKYLFSSTCWCIFSETSFLLDYCIFFIKETCKYYFFNIPNLCSNHFKIILQCYRLVSVLLKLVFSLKYCSQVKAPWFLLVHPLNILKLIVLS